MKKLISIVSAACIFSLTAHAQLGNLGKVINDSGILNATNYSFEPYATYAPQAPKGRQWGGGLLAIYNVNDFVGLGLGGDYLGQFTMFSGNATLKLPIHPFKSFTNSPFISSIEVTPFALEGIGTPLSGTGPNGAIAIMDTGGAIKFGHVLGGQFNTGVAWGRWDNAGIYSGTRYHIFAGWSYGF